MMRSSLTVVPCLWMAGVLAYAGCTDWDAYQVSPGAPRSSSSAGTGGAAPTSGPSGGAGGNGGGGEASTAPCGGFSLLADAFTSTGGPATVWEPSGTIAIAEGEAVAKIPGGSNVENWSFFTSQYFYDLRGDAISIEVKSSDPATSVITYLKLYYNDANYVEISEEKGQISFTKSVAGKWSSVGETAYDAAAHRFWRYREDSGMLYWETSGDGVDWKVQASSSNLFDLSGVKIEFGVGADANEASPGEAHFDNVNGGTPKGGWCKASALKDDFEDPKLGHGWARAYFDSACEHLESGELIFKVAQGTSGGCSYRSASAVDLTGDTLAVKVPLGPAPATGGEAVFEAYLEGNPEQSVQFLLQGGQLSCLTRLGDSFKVIDDVPYDATAHRFWRLREAAGQTFWEASADGQAWKGLAEAPNPFPLTALTVRLSGNSWSKEPSPVEIHFDNLNMP